MMSARIRSAFVPHDLKAPIEGAESGPLAGLTVAIKDMYDIEGERTGGGNPDWLAAQQPASRNASVVQSLLSAGATITGKTICDEFFYSIAGVNAHYGTPNNPRAPGRLPGGSSSGSASAAASSACDIAIGSDTGGSIRVPASFCGLYGIRTTHGRVDLTGAMHMAASFDVCGWFSNGPGTFRKVGGVLLDGISTAAEIANLVVVNDAFAEADADVASLMQQALAAMAGHLPSPSLQRIAPEGLDVWREAFRVIQSREIWSAYGEFIERAKPKFGPGVAERFAAAAKVTEDEAAQARVMQERARDRIRSIARPGTLLVLPTCPAIAPLTHAPNDVHEAFRVRAMRMTCIAGLSGLPQVSLPVGTLSGRPAGLSFIGWAGGDEALLDLAVKLSRYCGLAA
ncbi:MAG: amidase [Pseudorhodoplanes sp.]